METSDWIQAGIGVVGITVAILVATYFAGRQNKNILKQNLEIETYRELWLKVEAINNSLVEFSSYVNLQLQFTEQTIQADPNFAETDTEESFRKRRVIQQYNVTYDAKSQDITKAMGMFHQLWEQKEPMLSGLEVAFKTYLNEYERFKERLLFPSQARLLLDLENFADNKVIVFNENEELIDSCITQIVYGIDISRLVQEKLVSTYFNHKPSRRGLGAEKGYELTKSGLVPVGTSTKKNA